MLRIALSVTFAALIMIASNVSEAGEIGVQVTFSDKEISMIRAYYADHRRSQHRGLHKFKGRKSLPPGIAKNLQRGKPLPPGIAKQVLPPGLIDILPPPPRGYERIVVAGKILLVEIATQVVHDILADIILG